MASKESIEEDRTCSVCKVVMNFIDKELGTDRARRRVESIVRHVCMHLPLGLSRSCKAFIDKHSDAIIDVITHDVSPKEVCGILRFCELFMEQELKGISKYYADIILFNVRFKYGLNLFIFKSKYLRVCVLITLITLVVYVPIMLCLCSFKTL